MFLVSLLLHSLLTFLPAAPVALPSPRLPPTGSVLPLQEVKEDKSKVTIGTLVVISPQGLCVTALHAIEWGGFVYPDALEADGCKLVYLAGFREDDVAALQLCRNSGDSGGSSGSDSPYVEEALLSRGKHLPCSLAFLNIFLAFMWMTSTVVTRV